MKKLILLFVLFVMARLRPVLSVFILLFPLTSVTYSQLVSQLPPVSSPPLKLGQSVVTSYEFFSNPTDNVVRVIDTRNIPPFVVGGNYWNAPPQYAGADWTKARMRSVYGIALSDASSPDIFVSASTSIYFPCAQMGTNDSVLIFKIDGSTWGVGNYTMRDFSAGPPLIGVNKIPNTGTGIGNICFDSQHKQILATNMEDGRIYRVGAGGVVLSTFDPFGPDNGLPGFPPIRERLFGIGSYGTSTGNVKVYFSRWNSDYTNRGMNNQIWSVDLDNAGEFIPSTLSLKITLPFFLLENFSAPVTDIEFSFSGDMLLGERSFDGDCSGAHFSRILEYPRDVLGNYPTFIIHKVGVYASNSNSCGGVDFDYGVSDSVTKSNSLCDSNIVGTGDYLYSTSGGLVYGVQVTDRSQSAVDPNFLNFSHFIDLNGTLSGSDKRSPGDIDVYRKNLCGDTICLSILSDTIYCDSTGTYIYEFKIHNNSPSKYIEQIEITVDSPQPPNYVVAVPSTINIYPPIPPNGASGVQKVKLIGPGATATSEVCYTLSANFVHEDCPWCCFIENCIKLPICGTCAEVMQDSIYCDNGEYVYNFTLKNGTIYDVTKIQLTSPGVDPITFIPQTFHFGTPVLPGQMFPNLSARILGGAAGMTIPVRIKLFSGTFECCYFELPYTLPPCDTLHLDLTSFIQGRYNDAVNLMIGDTIEVELRNNYAPYSLVEKSKGYLNDSGKCTLNYYYATNATNYYIVLKHRNSIETWSKSPGQSFSAGVLNFDFLSLSQAYGQNLRVIDSIPLWFGIFSGDVNQDGQVNLADIILISNNSSNFINGYVTTDLNGDNLTNLTDILIALGNSNVFVNKISP
ncbi:MAG: hypothetical protein ABI462_03280 [Ignavibacteria bacterium]